MSLWHHPWVGEEAAVVFCELLRVSAPTPHHHHSYHFGTLKNESWMSFYRFWWAQPLYFGYSFPVLPFHKQLYPYLNRSQCLFYSVPQDYDFHSAGSTNPYPGDHCFVLWCCFIYLCSSWTCVARPPILLSHVGIQVFVPKKYVTLMPWKEYCENCVKCTSWIKPCRNSHNMTVCDMEESGDNSATIL